MYIPIRGPTAAPMAKMTVAHTKISIVRFGFGAREWGRPSTSLRPPDFESCASDSSATRARRQNITKFLLPIVASCCQWPVISGILERKSGAQLQFASRRHRHGDRSELRGIHVAVRSAQVDLVQRVECFGPELEIDSLADAEGSRQREVQGLHARAIHGVPACIAVRKRRGRGECGGIKPLRSGVRARAEYGLACNVGTDRILAQHGPGVRRISEDGDRKGHSRLDLVDGWPKS